MSCFVNMVTHPKVPHNFLEVFETWPKRLWSLPSWRKQSHIIILFCKYNAHPKVLHLFMEVASAQKNREGMTRSFLFAKRTYRVIQLLRPIGRSIWMTHFNFNYKYSGEALMTQLLDAGTWILPKFPTRLNPFHISITSTTKNNFKFLVTEQHFCVLVHEDPRFNQDTVDLA